MAEQADGSTSRAYIVAGSVDGWAQEAADQGRRGTQRLLDVSVEPPTPDVRAALQLPDDEQVVVRARLILLDDVPVELATSYYPASIAAGSPLAKPSKIRGGAVAALADLGHAPADVEEQVTARLPEPHESTFLQVGPTEPLLILTRVNSDQAGRRVEFAVNRMVARLNRPIAYRLRASA